MKINKLLAYTLIGTTLLSILPASAATYSNSIASFENQETTKDSTQNTTVYAEIASSFKVTIPKKITLDGALKKGTYTVTVIGDIAGTETINVLPDKSFALNSKNLNDITAQISQDKTNWGCNEILENTNTIGNGTIDANSITAGSWNGNFNFNINLSTKPGVYDNQGQLLMNWEDFEMDVTKDQDSNSLLDDPTSSANVFLGIKAPEVKVVIPYGTTKIGSYAFFDCDKLNKIEIPNTVTEIGAFAFSSSGLKEIVIPDSVTEIKEFTFDTCSDLTTVTLGNNTQSIGKYAFYQCINLEKITMPENIEIGINAFEHCFKLQ